MTREQAHYAAMGYAWGRQDMGDQSVDSHDAFMFSEFFASAWDGFNRPDCRSFSMRPVKDMYEQWVGGWRTMGQVLP